MEPSDTAKPCRWLVLIYQFPQGPGSRRVKVWRRLQGVGAIAIKNSVYVLPQSDQSQEDFQWLLAELKADGADAALLDSSFVDGMTDAEVRGLFNEARDADYLQTVNEISDALAGLSTEEGTAEDTLQNARRALARGRKRMEEIEAIDFFGASERGKVLAGLSALDLALAARPTGNVVATSLEMAKGHGVAGPFQNRVWVTRSGVRVDRIASAWLIRRWIDADARFKFVAAKDYAPASGELRFDMFEAEFTHEGDRCTFEVLADQFAGGDAALQCVAQIVHDIDLKDAKYNRPETEGIAHLITGLVAGTSDDDKRIERGSVLFEDLYRYFHEAVQ